MMEYHNITKLGSPGIPNWVEVLQSLPNMSFKVRKQLITMCRSRYYPDKGTRLYFICSDVISTVGKSPAFVQFMMDLFKYPVLTGFFLSAILSCPYSKAEVEIIRDELLWKEVKVMESVPRLPEIRWHILSDLKDYCLHPHLSIASVVPRQIRQILHQWFTICSKTVLYPHSGNKTVSRNTKRRYYETIQEEELDEPFTTTNVEQFYAMSGIQLEGSCEMRQKWYPSNSSPRTYYAMGGTAYMRSRYLRNAVNWLCDLFSPCHRKKRVRPDWIRVDESDEVYIYDLSSFTSNMHEQRSFLNFLGQLSQGIEVTYMDSYSGLSTCDLGQMIMEYNELNSQPKYSMERVWNVDLELTHSVAGFLGVYANLMTCTFPHSIVLSTVKDNASRSWCAGDDAGTGCSDGERIVHETADVVGTLAHEKVYVLSEPGSQALKRKVSRIPTGILVHNSALWPSWCMLFRQDWRFDKTSLSEKRAKFASAVVPFLQSILNIPKEPIEREFIMDCLTEAYSSLNLPCEGWLPLVQGYARRYTVPIVGKYTLDKDPLIYLADSYYIDMYVGPEIDGEEFDESMLDLESWTSFSSPRLAHLERLGYVVSEKVTRMYEGDMGREILRNHVLGNIRKQVNRYTIVEPIPGQLKFIHILS